MKQIPFAILIFVALLFISQIVAAQKELPVSERDVFYLYQEFGLANQDKPKIIVISSHLYRYKFNDNSHGRIATNLSLAYGKKMDEVYNNEYVSGEPGYKQVSRTNALEINNAFLNQGIARATGPETYLTLSNTTELLKKSRELLINDFEKEGYNIFQVDFGEYIDFNNLGLEKVEKLSSLWITSYRKGLLLAVAEPYQRRTGSASSGITVETDKSKRSTKTSTAQKEDNTNWAAIAEAKRWEAGLLESEGDRLLNSGSISDALEFYKRAQHTFYTDRVQQKINNAESTLQGSAALIGGGLDLAQDVGMAFDDMKVPKFSAWGITYSGLAPDDRYKGVQQNLIPSSTSLTYGGYRIFALEMGISYVRSPVYTMYLTNNDGRKLNQNVQVNRSTIGPTASFGLAIPFKHFVVYGMYGWNIPFWVTEANLLTSGYVYKEIKEDLGNISFEPKTDVGIKFKVPGTRLGIGAHYRMNKHIGKKIKLSTNGYSVISNGSQQYFVGGSEKEFYKHETIGFSLYLLMKK